MIPAPPQGLHGEQVGRTGLLQLLVDIGGYEQRTESGDRSPGAHDAVEGDGEGEAVRRVEPHDRPLPDAADGQCSGGGVHHVLQFPVGDFLTGGAVGDRRAGALVLGERPEESLVDGLVGNDDLGETAGCGGHEDSCSDVS